MQLPDEAISYQYQSLVLPFSDDWSLLSEFRKKELIPAARLKALSQQIMQVRSQVATERDLQNPPPELQPLDAGFIDLPQKHLDAHRRKADASELGRVLRVAGTLRDLVDRVVILGIGGSSLGGRAIFDALTHSYHNELPPKTRLGIPRVYFAGDNLDNDALQDLLELLENSCVDPEIREERYGLVIISKTGETLETAIAHRVLRGEITKYYGPSSPLLKHIVVPITGSSGKFRNLTKKYGYSDEDILSIPDNVGSRFSVFTPAGLLPAAMMGLDVRALLLGAASMTRRFLEEPFERNPVLQFAAVNYLMSEELGKPIRVMALWSRKMETVGRWYDHLVAESLGKQGRGPTPLTVVNTRDLHTRGQQHQDGARDKLINHVVVKNPKAPPIALGMAEHNEDDLNAYNRKTMPDILSAAYKGAIQAHTDVVRPAAEINLPVLSEHTMGQLLQMLMIAIVVEGRLMGINPYGQPGAETYRKQMKAILKGS